MAQAAAEKNLAVAQAVFQGIFETVVAAATQALAVVRNDTDSIQADLGMHPAKPDLAEHPHAEHPHAEYPDLVNYSICGGVDDDGNSVCGGLYGENFISIDARWDGIWEIAPTGIYDEWRWLDSQRFFFNPDLRASSSYYADVQLDQRLVWGRIDALLANPWADPWINPWAEPQVAYNGRIYGPHALTTLEPLTTFRGAWDEVVTGGYSGPEPPAAENPALADVLEDASDLLADWTENLGVFAAGVTSAVTETFETYGAAAWESFWGHLGNEGYRFVDRPLPEAGESFGGPSSDVLTGDDGDGKRVRSEWHCRVPKFF